MKKIFILAAIALTAGAANAQQTYNYFDAADVDANGWLWLDSQAKIDKYCGVISGGKTFKVGLVDATYENDDFEYPACSTSPTVQGWNAEGVKGGAGSKTGGIILPAAKSSFFLGWTASDTGGGILLNLPDCAELDIYVSTAKKDVFLGAFGAAGEARASDCQYIMSYQEQLFSDDPLPDATYCGYWNNIQDYTIDKTDENGKVISTFQIKSDKATTGYIVNLDEAEMILHGLKILTYTEHANVAAVAAEADADAPTYNLLGQRVDDTYRGLVIRSGRKFIQR